MIGIGDLVVPPQFLQRQRALLGHLAHGTLLDPLARLQLALGQIPPPVAENHQHASPGIRDQTAARFDQGHRRAELAENGLYFFGYYG